MSGFYIVSMETLQTDPTSERIDWLKRFVVSQVAAREASGQPLPVSELYQVAHPRKQSYMRRAIFSLIDEHELRLFPHTEDGESYYAALEAVHDQQTT